MPETDQLRQLLARDRKTPRLGRRGTPEGTSAEGLTMDGQESSTWTSPPTNIAGEPRRTSRERRGLTIGHWLMIIIVVALCADIGIRILAFLLGLQESMLRNAASGAGNPAGISRPCVARTRVHGRRFGQEQAIDGDDRAIDETNGRDSGAVRFRVSEHHPALNESLAMSGPGRGYSRSHCLPASPVCRIPHVRQMTGIAIALRLLVPAYFLFRPAAGLKAWNQLAKDARAPRPSRRS